MLSKTVLVIVNIFVLFFSEVRVLFLTLEKQNKYFPFLLTKIVITFLLTDVGRSKEKGFIKETSELYPRNFIIYRNLSLPIRIHFKWQNKYKNIKSAIVLELKIRTHLFLLLAAFHFC